jgi:transcription elongation factor GreA
MAEKKPIFLTKEGFEEIKQELDYLINVARPENINAIKEARALGDLSENADYDAARNDQAELENKIKKLEAIVENVTIIDEVSTDKVGVGTTVKISYVDDEDDTDQYKIVGSQEADPFESKISNESPIAKALMGHKVGDIVSVESPNGNYEVKVVEIK